MISGSISNEFMLLKPVGEDSIVTCGNCDYRANMETAESIVENETSDIVTPLEKIHTPGMKTIEDVCDFLKIPILNSYKAVVYQKDITNEYVVVFIRGDLDVNETKLKNYLHKEIHPAAITDESGICAGFIGPLNLKNVEILFDRSLEGIQHLCCGANENDYPLHRIAN